MKEPWKAFSQRVPQISFIGPNLGSILGSMKVQNRMAHLKSITEQRPVLSTMEVSTCVPGVPWYVILRMPDFSLYC